MSFVCPLCRENWIFTARLCSECEKIRHLIATYSLNTINEVLHKVLVINKFKQEKILEKTKEVDTELNTIQLRSKQIKRENTIN
jgi:hypothetical protein|tara:strand:- start:5320 stop:5571 length:252 start_codon:yes stop_codon:yes gene_type:complete